MFERKEDPFYKRYYLFGKCVWKKQKSAKEMVSFLMSEMENHCTDIKSLSKKCAKYVKKSINENKELILGQKEDTTNAANEQVKTAKDTVAETKTTVKTSAKAAGKELKDTAKAVKTPAIETGKAVKEIVTE